MCAGANVRQERLRLPIAAQLNVVGGVAVHVHLRGAAGANGVGGVEKCLGKAGARSQAVECREDGRDAGKLSADGQSRGRGRSCPGSWGAKR